MLQHIKTLEMTATKSKFWLAFWFRLDSVPVTGRNFSGILNLDSYHCKMKMFSVRGFTMTTRSGFNFRKLIFDSGRAGALPSCANVILMMGECLKK